mmetsp:Transcript_26210/g.43393  ORF Transcript_26210/g.43393 Transcript_26210/m.43393 type:complete len:102 (+) Transcript_26210:1310-1615(+)
MWLSHADMCVLGLSHAKMSPYCVQPILHVCIDGALSKCAHLELAVATCHVVPQQPYNHDDLRHFCCQLIVAEQSQSYLFYCPTPEPGQKNAEYDFIFLRWI